MNYSKLFSFRNILKIFLISLSLIFWIYFYISSKVNLDIIIIFDLPSIINTFFTTNFLIFLILFPITTSLIISFSYKGDNKTHIIITSCGIILGSLLSLFIFKLNFKFMLFLLLYLIAHIITSIFTKVKFENEPKKSILDTANYSCSKITLFLSIVLFIVLFISLLPQQQEKAITMEAGIVNIFVGDDLSNWLGTSYSISKSCSKQNLDHIMSQTQYLALENKTDPESINFTRYMDSIYESIENDSSFNLANLDNLKVKENVLETIRSIPLMVVVEEYFAFVFSFMVISLAYLYFGLAFGILGVLFILIFRKLINSNKNNKTDNSSSNNSNNNSGNNSTNDYNNYNNSNNDSCKNTRESDSNITENKDSIIKEDIKSVDDENKNDLNSFKFSQK
jgi:hypothetical protein